MWVLDWQRSRTECPACGNPIEVCSDPGRSWYPYRRVCYATMEREAAQDAYAALHEKAPYHDGTFTHWAEKQTASHPYQHSHGVTIGTSDTDLTPWDHFTTERDASPVRPADRPEEPPQDETSAEAPS